jgi:hypothetical protein
MNVTLRRVVPAALVRNPIYRARHRRTIARHQGRRIALVAAIALFAALTPAPFVAAVTPPNVLTAVVHMPDGTRAAGAVATLSTPIAGSADLPIGTSVADASGGISITIPTTPELLARAHRSIVMTTLPLVLDVTVEKVLDDVTYYYRAVEALAAGLVGTAMTGMQAYFVAPAPHVVDLIRADQIDPLAAATAGLQTLADMAQWVADTSTAEAALVVQALQSALVAHDISPDNPVVAYDVNTAEGTMIYATTAPGSIVLNPVDADVWEVLPLGATAPAVDTTQAADEVAGVLALLPPIAEPAQGGEDAARGTWGKNNSDCYTVYGPKDQSDANKRYLRTVCWEIDFQNADSNKTDSFWQFELEANGNSLHGTKMQRMWVEGVPQANHTAPMTFDGISVPQSTDERRDPCNTSHTSFSLKSGEPLEIGSEWTWDKVSCETYGPKLYADEGHYATIWTGNPDVPSETVRYVKLAMPVRTKTKDGGVVWSLLTGQATVH